VLLVEFLVTVAVLAALLAAGYALTDGRGADLSYPRWWMELFLALLSFPSDAVLSARAATDRGALQVVTAVGGLVVPALFVGGVVLKLFISPDLFTVRNRVALLPNAPDDPRLEPGGHHLAVRGYSSTPFRLLGVTFSAILRFEQRDDDGNALLVHRELRVANPSYAIAYSHVPYTLSVPIADDDWDADHDGELARLQGFPLGSAPVLIVLISGQIPELSSDFTESHEYPLRERLSRRQYAGLAVDFGRPATEWAGWEDFDEQ
jgi:hypothetical protein